MRPRDDPAERGRDPAGRRHRPNARERVRPRRDSEVTPRGRECRAGASPALVPGATLAALGVVAILAAVRSASGLLREWSIALAVLAVAASCWLGAVAVAHVAARVAARRGGEGR